MIDSDVDSLYVTRNERREGLISSKECVVLAIRGLELYIHDNQLMTPD